MGRPAYCPDATRGLASYGTGRCEPWRGGSRCRGERSRGPAAPTPPSGGPSLFLASVQGSRETDTPERPLAIIGNRMGKRVLLASRRGYCAGVERAIETVERAIELHGPPVYVRRQI